MKEYKIVGFQLCINEEPYCRSSQLSTLRRLQAYLEKKGKKNVVIYTLIDEK